MAGNFMKYAGSLTPGDMPVDAHEAYCHVRAADRSVSGGATKEMVGWTPRECFWRLPEPGPSLSALLGKQDMGTTEFSGD